MLHDQQLDGLAEVDSAATHGYRVGETSDRQIQRLAEERGYDLSQHRARKIGWQDLDYFDLILAMDRSNLDNLRRMATQAQQEKIHLLMDYGHRFSEKDIPDPYTTLGQSFDRVLAMIEDGCAGVVDSLRAEAAAALRS